MIALNSVFLYGHPHFPKMSYPCTRSMAIMFTITHTHTHNMERVMLQTMVSVCSVLGQQVTVNQSSTLLHEWTDKLLSYKNLFDPGNCTAQFMSIGELCKSSSGNFDSLSLDHRREKESQIV